MEQQPRFRYHPDPIATHSIQPREGFTCGVCGEARSHAYIGPYFADNFGFENGDEICPWCIADGRAARDWNATFISPANLTDAARHAMPQGALAELELRTPSFLCVEQEQWLDHHGEAAAYIGPVGYNEYQRLPPQAQAAVRQCGYSVERLRDDGDGPTAYLFRCLHCDWHAAFVAFGA
jgi:uncharacterized protein CbrC (UPF0167 family)